MAYKLRDIYTDIGATDTTEQTIPDPMEQKLLHAPAVSPAAQRNIWGGVILVVILFLLFAVF